MVQFSVVLNIRSMDEGIIQVGDFRNSKFPAQLNLELAQLCFHRTILSTCLGHGRKE